MSIRTNNPNTNKTVKSFEEMSDKTVHKKLGKAQKVFLNWRKTSSQQWAELLHKVASLMRAKKTKLAKTITLQMGKLLAQAEIDWSVNIFDYYADHGVDFLADKILNPEYGSTIIRNSKIGVLFGVIPWNFPFYHVARFAAPNIIVGNTILPKHAFIVPQCAASIKNIFEESDALKGLCTNLFITRNPASA